MDKLQIIQKIKKCLALSKSNNPHEAASALRHAQMLMKKYSLTEEDLSTENILDATAIQIIQEVEKETGYSLNPKQHKAVLKILRRELHNRRENV